jgi:hypothetical protein
MFVMRKLVSRNACREGQDMDARRQVRYEPTDLVTNIILSRLTCPGVLCHSVKLRTLPQETSLRDLLDLAGMMTSPTQ